MKYLNFLILLIFAVGGINCSSNKNLIRNLSKEAIENVKNITSVVYFPKTENDILSREIAFATKKYSIDNYNRQGHLISRYRFDKNGNITSAQEYLRNKYGEILESKSYSKPDYKKTKSGDIIITEIKSNFHEKYDYVYDDTLISIKIKTDLNSGKQWKTIYEYRDNHLIETVTQRLNSENKKTTKTNYSYTFNQFAKIDTKKSYKNGVLESIESFKYDSSKKKIEYILQKYVADTLATKDIFKYDSEGRRIETIFEKANGDFDKIVSQYNIKGVENKDTWYNETGKLFEKSWKFKRDTKGNVLTRMEFRNGNIDEVREYKYQYFN